MKRLAKVFRRWADKLDPPPQIIAQEYTINGTKKLQKFKAQVELNYPHEQIERKLAEDHLRKKLADKVAQGVEVYNYARHVTAEFYYYE